jgi:MFS family permease
VIGLAVTYFTGLGITKVVAAGAIGLYGIISIAGRLGSGVLSDLYEPRYVAAGGFLIQVAAMATMIMATDVTMVYLFAVLYGIALGLTYVCLLNLIVNYYGVNNFATINSVVMTVSIAVGAFSPFITGAIVDSTKSFTCAWIIVLVLSAISCICALVTIPPQKHEECNTSKTIG